MFLIGKNSLNVEGNTQLLNTTIRITLATKRFHDISIYIFFSCHNMASLIPEWEIMFYLVHLLVMYTLSLFSITRICWFLKMLSLYITWHPQKEPQDPLTHLATCDFSFYLIGWFRWNEWYGFCVLPTNKKRSYDPNDRICYLFSDHSITSSFFYPYFPDFLFFSQNVTKYHHFPEFIWFSIIGEFDISFVKYPLQNRLFDNFLV